MGTSLRELQPQYQRFAMAFVSALRRAGLRVTVTSVRRDSDAQARLWANFERCGCSACPPRPGRCYPVARPGSSPHEQGIAWDMSIEPREGLYVAGRVWESLGLRWGGSFRRSDPVHFDFLPTHRP